MGATRARTETAPPEEVIAEWSRSTFRVRQIAAAWGRELLSQPKGTRVESSMKIADRLVEDHSLVVRARNLLADAKIICKWDEDNRYHVAQGSTPVTADPEP